MVGNLHLVYLSLTLEIVNWGLKDYLVSAKATLVLLSINSDRVKTSKCIGVNT